MIDSSIRQCQLIRGMPGYKSYTECFPNKPIRTHSSAVAGSGDGSGSGTGAGGIPGASVAGTSSNNNPYNYVQPQARQSHT